MTAVEWLEEQICTIQIGVSPEWLLNAIEQAKELEKQQIMKARQDIFHTGNLTNEQYYNETFKSE